MKKEDRKIQENRDFDELLKIHGKVGSVKNLKDKEVVIIDDEFYILSKQLKILDKKGKHNYKSYTLRKVKTPNTINKLRNLMEGFY